MKKILLAAALMSAATAKAQMTLEHSYQPVSYFQVVNLEDEGEKYAMYDTTTKTLKLHNPDHSLWKTIQIPISAGFSFSNVYCLSTKFFNGDSKVELFYSEYNYTQSKYNGYVINEDGNILNTLPDVYYLIPAKVGNGWKVYCTSQLYKENVYSVPGSMPTPTGLKPAEMKTSDATIYPNPAGEKATLRYTLPSGTATGTLHVFDASGRVVRSYQVSNMYNDVLIHTGDLTPGVYTYKLTAEGAAPASARFVVE